MVKKQNSKSYDPKKQFSKKLAGRTEWFWFFYMVIVIALLAYQPTVGNVVIYLAGLVTIVMITSVLAYTSNSRYDKALYTMRVLGWHTDKSKQKDNDNSEDTSEEDEEENYESEEGDVG